jgi:hypothetical protein
MKNRRLVIASFEGIEPITEAERKPRAVIEAINA